VNEQGLVLTLCKMQYAHDKREFLKLRSRCVRVVKPWTSEVHERVDKERAEVFDNEDSPPRNLGTWNHLLATAYTTKYSLHHTKVLYIHSALVPEAGLVDRDTGSVGNG
jgi:hypothetical protein